MATPTSRDPGADPDPVQLRIDALIPQWERQLADMYDDAAESPMPSHPQRRAENVRPKTCYL